MSPRPDRSARRPISRHVLDLCAELWWVAPWNGRLTLGAAAGSAALSVALFLPIPATADAVGAVLLAAFLPIPVAAFAQVPAQWRSWSLRVACRVHAMPPGHGAPRGAGWGLAGAGAYAALLTAISLGVPDEDRASVRALAALLALFNYHVALSCIRTAHKLAWLELRHDPGAERGLHLSTPE